MGFLDRMINKAVGDATSSASSAIGAAVGAAVGGVVGGVVAQGGKSLTNEMEKANQLREIQNKQEIQNKELELKQNALNAELAMENQRKANELPTNCPHCGAPTNNQLVCEYCRCKVVE